jgi:amino acid transporter
MVSTGVDYSPPSGPLGEKRVVTEEKAPTYGYDAEGRRASVTLSAKSTYDSTHRMLKPRHIQLIGIGGTIGTALFVQIGHGLLNGGPASLFLAFTFW